MLSFIGHMFAVERQTAKLRREHDMRSVFFVAWLFTKNAQFVKVYRIYYEKTRGGAFYEFYNPTNFHRQPVTFFERSTPRGVVERV